ncbi:MAG: DUF1700 domain-containing protein [Lachnospiraceae bacterium]
MNRMEFMRRLEQALTDVSAEERQEALQYYRDYLDDAGVDETDQIPESLGMPEKIAESIRGSVEGGAESGNFTERGFTVEENKNYPAKQQEIYYRDQMDEERSSRENKSRPRNGWKLIAILLLGILFSPIWIPVSICVLAVVFAIFMVLVAFLAVLVASGVALLAGGIGVVILGFTQLAVSAAGAVVLIGVGLLMTAVGFLLTVFFGWIFFKAVVAIFRWLVALCRKPFHRKKDSAAASAKGGETA